MNDFTPLVTSPVPERWVKGIPAYDTSLKLTKLIELFSKHLYGAPFVDFNVFFAFVNDDLKNTLARLTPYRRVAFDKEARAFAPSKIMGTRPVYSTPGPDYDEVESGPFVPVVTGNESYPTEVDDWTGYLLDAVIEAKGWVYSPLTPAVPFTETACAPYHFDKLMAAFYDEVPIAVKLNQVLELGLDKL